MAKKNIYKKGSVDTSFDELSNEIITGASDQAFERFWVKEPEEVEEIPVNKGSMTSHIVEIAQLYGEMSAVKAVVQINNEFGTAYTIQDIQRIWNKIDAEWKARQAEEEE